MAYACSCKDLDIKIAYLSSKQLYYLKVWCQLAIQIQMAIFALNSHNIYHVIQNTQSISAQCHKDYGPIIHGRYG